MKHKAGTYDVFVQKKGKQEAFIEGIKEGETYFTVWTETTGGFDTKDQGHAIILSELLQLRRKLNKIEKMIDNIDK